MKSGFGLRILNIDLINRLVLSGHVGGIGLVLFGNWEADSKRIYALRLQRRTALCPFLCRLMLNYHNPNVGKRPLFADVLQSILLYGDLK